MNPKSLDGMAISARLATLEMQHRRWKRMVIAALILAAAILLMGQASLKKTVEADEFVLKDAKGKVRGRFDMAITGPEIVLFDSNGKAEASLAVIETRDVMTNGPALSLSDANGKMRGLFALSAKDGPEVGLLDPNEKVRTLMGQTYLQLSDKEGFQTTVGITDLVTPRTGETHRTSAASVVLLDKDKKVMWKAP